MKKTIYSGRNIGAYDWLVSFPSENCPASMAYNHYHKDFEPKKSDRLSFYIARQLGLLGATKIKKGFYFFEDKKVAVDFFTDGQNIDLALIGSEEDVGELETVLLEEVTRHRERNDRRLAERNRKLREAGLRYKFYIANDK